MVLVPVLYHWSRGTSEAWVNCLGQMFGTFNVMMMMIDGACFKRVWLGLVVATLISIVNLSTLRAAQLTAVDRLYHEGVGPTHCDCCR